MPKHSGEGKAKAKVDDGTKDWGYMRWPSIQCLYKELETDLVDNRVDTLWSNILQLYFKVEYNYAIKVPQANPNRQSRKKDDFAVRCVHNGVPGKLFLVGNKRVSDESSGAAWAEATMQLFGYMAQAREVNPTPDRAMYGIVTTGHYSRFHTLSPGANALSNFSSRKLSFAFTPIKT
ncbi:hypothetical protein ACRE_040550 [Hapsidospora chrysogenum ATCC 11550]|uniref:Uncharacterized protein n=1 Tax=Hapsidospora chrysogenum (strain ATCC 11550 / CBS 779.69 / DSM 880 / IAM 14645 / JCM 23072 / IMI 49137) TaxID=857340 RepID=A0A086T6Y0_HAPC1|nr:hypothetical protein ACRE_040550 [Hapsidospora chrysogenum ATCC 11550]